MPSADQVGKAQEVATLARRLVDLHAQMQAVRSEQERSVIRRAIVAADGRMDQLAADLYGLSPEERQIIEKAKA